MGAAKAAANLAQGREAKAASDRARRQAVAAGASAAEARRRADAEARIVQQRPLEEFISGEDRDAVLQRGAVDDIPPGAEDLVFKEWSECRATIGRFDQLLEDLRKFAFTLITGLLTASAFLGYGSGHPTASVAAFIAVMCMIGALFAVDIYYSVMLAGAVERARDLEALQTIRETIYISHRTHDARTKYVILGVYLFLLVIACGLGVSAGVSGGLSPEPVVFTVAIGFGLFAIMLGYWIGVGRVTGLFREAPRRPLEPDPAQTVIKQDPERRKRPPVPAQAATTPSPSDGGVAARPPSEPATPAPQGQRVGRL